MRIIIMSILEHPCMPYRTAVMINGVHHQTYHYNRESAERDNQKFLNMRPYRDYFFSVNNKSGLKRITIKPLAQSVSIQFMFRPENRTCSKYYIITTNTRRHSISEILDTMWAECIKYTPENLYYEPTEVLDVQLEFYNHLNDEINKFIA